MLATYIFASSMMAYGIFFLALSVFISKSDDSVEKVSFREKLCREKISGLLMSFAAFIWCAMHGSSIFLGQAISSYFIPMAFILTWLAYFLLDFLPARSAGALMILISHYHLQWVFALNPPLSPLVSITCFFTGTCGIIISGKPCLARDFFRAVSKSSNQRKFCSAISLACGIVYIACSVYHLVNGK
ncbi:MAG TPA: hypothetical protein PK821_03045 [Victivallales bacterium]|nr:hypothetical protein [Victivallales bacterium]